jgi:hypothetical protein
MPQGRYRGSADVVKIAGRAQPKREEHSRGSRSLKLQFRRHRTRSFDSFIGGCCVHSVRQTILLGTALLIRCGGERATMSVSRFRTLAQASARFEDLYKMSNDRPELGWRRRFHRRGSQQSLFQHPAPGDHVRGTGGENLRGIARARRMRNSASNDADELCDLVDIDCDASDTGLVVSRCRYRLRTRREEGPAAQLTSHP